MATELSMDDQLRLQPILLIKVQLRCNQALDWFVQLWRTKDWMWFTIQGYDFIRVCKATLRVIEKPVTLLNTVQPVTCYNQREIIWEDKIEMRYCRKEKYRFLLLNIDQYKLN